MQLKTTLLIAVCALPFSAAMAQDKVVAPSPSSRTNLDLYAQPGETTAVRQIAVAEAGLPLPVKLVQTGYYQVAIAGQDYWLRGMQVRIGRDTAAGCTTSAAAPVVATIATPGAGKDACK